MKIIKKIMTFAITASMLGSFTACQDMFEPAVENFKDESDLLDMPAWATGLLGHAYISNPLGSWRFDDVATDDAVSNDLNNSYRKMAAGSWRADNNPQDRWQYLRASWQYLNQFIEIVDQVDWAADEVVAELFRMRFKLPETYRFTYFSDKEGMVFKAISTENGSFVMPDVPFSIVDKLPFIKTAGFSRFLLDFSKTQVRKNQLKQVLSALYKQIPLPDTSRFNWKDGFYSPEKMEEYRQANLRLMQERADKRETKHRGKPRSKSSRNTNPKSIKH